MSATADAQAARAELERQLLARLEAPARTWLARALAADLPADHLAEAQRQLGTRHLVTGFAARAGARLASPWGELAVGHWRLAEAGRVLLLAAEAAAHPGAERYHSLFGRYDQGDTETRVAALRALNLVGGPELTDDETAPGLELVLDAGRTNVTGLMAAAWCHNPFASARLSDHDYRKAVLKAFFCGVDVGDFVGLSERADPELSQSLGEYIDERLAAGRPVPAKIWEVAAHHPRPGLVARLIGQLEHPDREERLAAARALARARDPRAQTFLEERLERETDPEVKQALEAAAQQERR